MATNSIVAIILNNFLLPIIEKVACVRVNELLALMLCITSNFIKKRIVLVKC